MISNLYSKDNKYREKKWNEASGSQLADHTICCMGIDPETGLLSYSKTEIAAESPVCAVFKTK